MRIAVMADIHGNRAALETCVAEARRRGAEEYLFLGDYLGEMAYPERTLELLETLRKVTAFFAAIKDGSSLHLYPGKQGELLD